MAKDKTTFKKIASELGMKERTLRNTLKRSNYLKGIEDTLENPEKYKQFEAIFDQRFDNKKDGISTEQIRILSMLCKEDLEPIIDHIIRRPENAKQIIRNVLPCRERVTLSISGLANEWFRHQADEMGVSKSQYLQNLIEGFYEMNIEEG